MREIKFCNLKERQEYMEVVGKRIYEAFVKGKKEITLEEVIKKLEVVKTIVAVDGNKCLGSVAIFGNDLKSREDLTPWLASLYVAPEYRSMGVGAGLMEEVKKEVAKQGYKKVYLITGNAHEYYMKRGWHLVEPTEDEEGSEIGVYEFSL